MRKQNENLLEDVKKCLTDPIYNIIKNFSLEKSKEYYNKWAKQWNAGDYRLNPANKQEEVSFDFGSLNDLAIKSIEAQNLYHNLKKEDFIKGCEWCVYGQNIVVRWNRLKTFDEWLYDGLFEALKSFYQDPEGGVRRMLVKELGKGYYENTDIHLFVEGKIDEETLVRLANFEKAQKIEGRDIEEDILQARKALEDMEVCNKNNVEVLQLKM